MSWRDPVSLWLSVWCAAVCWMRELVRPAIVMRGVLVVATLVLWGRVTPHSAHVKYWLDAAARTDETHESGHLRAAYDNVLRLTGESPDVYARLVQMSLDAGDFDSAQIYLLALADRSGWNATRREWLREIRANTGDELGEAALFYAGRDAQAADPDTLRQLARHQIERLEWAQAEETITHLLQLVPDDAGALYWRGILLAPDDQEQAEDCLVRAAADPDWAAQANAVREVLPAYGTHSATDAHTRLGTVLVGLGEWAFAERALTLALEANAVNPVALAYRGYVRDRQGRDGLPDLRAAQAMVPNDPLIHYMLGQHWRMVDDHVAAHDAFLYAYTLDRENPALAVEVASSLQHMGEFDRAERWFRRAVAMESDSVRWQRALAAFYADSGFNLATGGMAFIQQASAAHPDDADIAASLGWAFYRTGENQRAYDELNRAMNIDPASPRVRYYFGVVLEQRGDTAGAVDAYSYVVDTAGTDNRFGLLAARALRRLEQGPS